MLLLLIFLMIAVLTSYLRHKENRRLRRLAATDPLTGIMTRAAFSAKANKILKSSNTETHHGLLMMDIDNFKKINDTEGHMAGDATLVEFTAILRSVLRNNDLIARLGGDEFIALITDIPNADIASSKAYQICQLAHNKSKSGLELSASIGIAIAPEHGVDFDSLYTKADKALYYIKNKEKNNYAIYDEDITE